MLCMMIVAPRQPGNDIDVYLAPLIEDLRKLWEHGVDVVKRKMERRREWEREEGK